MNKSACVIRARSRSREPSGTSNCGKPGNPLSCSRWGQRYPPPLGKRLPHEAFWERRINGCRSQE